MFRALYLTDLHIMARTPRFRRDDYFDVMMAKLDEVIEISVKHEVNHILLGGDIFHTPSPAFSTLNAVASRFKRMKAESNYDTEISIALGSHDKYGYQSKTLKRTGVGLLKASGVIDNLLHPEYIVSGLHSVYIHGFHHEIDSQDVKQYHLKKDKTCKTLIEVIHAPIRLRNAAWDCILLKDIKTEADIVLTGDQHDGYGISARQITIGKNKHVTTFVNPGSFGRITKGDHLHPVKVCMISIDEDNDVKIELIPIKCAPKPQDEEVFIVTEATRSEKSKSIEEFVDVLRKNLNRFDLSDIEKVLAEVKKEKKISKQAFTLVQDTLKEQIALKENEAA